MNYDETAKVLAAIQIYDARHVDQATVKAWHKMIGRFTMQDCLNAVEAHFAESTEYLLPAHVIRRVKSIRSRRLALAENPVLNYDDEYDADGNRRPDAKRKHDHLINLVANGQLTAKQYELYRDGRISLQQLGALAKEITP